MPPSKPKLPQRIKTKRARFGGLQSDATAASSCDYACIPVLNPLDYVG
jgi:hypothetical protein